MCGKHDDDIRIAVGSLKYARFAVNDSARHCHAQYHATPACLSNRRQKFVEVNHNIFHLSIINRALSLTAPCFDCIVVSAKNADSVNAFGVNKFMATWVFYTATHDKVKFLIWSCLLHVIAFFWGGRRT